MTSLSLSDAHCSRGNRRLINQDCLVEQAGGARSFSCPARKQQHKQSTRPATTEERRTPRDEVRRPNSYWSTTRKTDPSLSEEVGVRRDCAGEVDRTWDDAVSDSWRRRQICSTQQRAESVQRDRCCGDEAGEGASRSWSMAGSKNFSVVTSSLIPLRLRVFTMNSLARCCAGDGSSGRRTMDLSMGSPGTICQLSKMDSPNACSRD